MKQQRIVLFVCMIVVALSVSCFQGQTLALASASPSCSRCVAWQQVHSPNVSARSNVLSGVAALSSRDTWAVGSSTWANTATRLNYTYTLVEHWNGMHWSIIPSPNVKGSISNRLLAVAALSSKNIWAVGSFTPFTSITVSNSPQTLIEHWNGRQWSIVPSPASSSTDLWAIAALSANDIWAVGSLSLIEHWNGKQWSIVTLPRALSGNYTGIAALSSKDIWIVGNGFLNAQGIAPTLALHWNGKAWSLVKSISPNRINAFRGITAVSANDIWAIGGGTNGITPHSVGSPLVEHWNGKQWSIVPIPVQGVTEGLAAMTAVSSHDFWMVGNRTDSPDPVTALYATFIAHWDGSSWHIVSSPSPGGIENGFSSVTHVPGTKTAWAVGFSQNDDSNAQTLIAAYCLAKN